MTNFYSTPPPAGSATGEGGLSKFDYVDPPLDRFCPEGFTSGFVFFFSLH